MTTSARPPGPDDWVPFRLLRRFSRDPLAFLTDTARTYGDMAEAHVAGQRLVMLSHPDLIQDVLVTHNHNFTKTETQLIAIVGNGLLGSEGDVHRRQRRALQPLFLRERVAHHAPAIVELTERHAAGWQEGATVPLYAELLALTQAIVGKTLFDADLPAEAGRVRELLEQAIRSGSFLRSLPLAHFLEKLPLPAMRRFHTAVAELQALMQTMIDAHRRTGQDRGDILSLMLRLREEHGAEDILTDEVIRSQTLTLFVAGHETTATALAWTWYLLARHRDVEAKMHEEIDRVLAGRAPTAADMPNLPYTEMVFAEAMRLYPPIFLMARKAIAPHTLGGFTFPAATVFLVSPYVVQRDPRWFPDPEKFDPERLSHEKRAKLHRFAYFPFGGGPRQCIGEAFSWLESVLILATLGRKWRLCWDEADDVQPINMFTLQPRGRLPMRLERRTPGAHPSEGASA